MKNSWKYILSAGLVATVATLAACGGGSGGNNSATPASTGAVVNSSNATAYVGNGTWSGSLNVSDPASYLQFLYEAQLCPAYRCGTPAGYFQLQISLSGTNGGYLPGPASFALRPYLAGGYQGSTMSQQADGYINAAQNGILLNYIGNGYGNAYSQPYTYGQPGYIQQPGFDPNNPATIMLQIITQYVDATHNSMAVQVYYRGRQIGSGTMQGNVYNQQQYGSQFTNGYPYGTVPPTVGGSYYYYTPSYQYFSARPR